MTSDNPQFAAYAPAPGERQPPVAAVVAGAVEEDVPVLAALQARARGGSAGEWAQRIRRALDAERSLVVTARVAGEVVGYANVAFLSAHAPVGYYLTGVTVDPVWRRRGLGRLLTEWRMEWVWGRGEPVWCFVSAENRASLDLHRELGFERVASGPSFQGVAFACGEGWLLRADPPSQGRRRKSSM
ncbi:GNAT family N-acetyltransferase [Kitasatospora sp. NPDC051170]|uniref:GNAT family N-acetyltransferase n=1 Tax=Kitasatospora sp. NPDC051170 TaxID=3364056 RepID=UPI00379E59A5